MVVLQVQSDLGTSAQSFAFSVFSDGECTTCAGFPDILLIIIVLGGNDNLVGNQVCRVETNTELTNQGHISTSLQSLHKVLCSRSSNSTQIVNQISLGHTNTAINEGQGLVVLVRNDLNEEFLFRIQNALVSQ
ncbi:hypothetical protein D3C80_1566630 [compost metagenome]